MVKSKVSQCSSGYGSNPYGFSCGVCNHFMPPYGCEIVNGKINREDCCNLFDSSTFKSKCRR